MRRRSAGGIERSVKPADARMRAIFNWRAEPQTYSFGLPEASYITDYWSGESLDRHEDARWIDE